MSDDVVCVVVKALLTETLFTLLVVAMVMETSHEVLTIKLKLGDVAPDGSVEFTLPLPVVTCTSVIEPDDGKTDEMFVV